MALIRAQNINAMCMWFWRPAQCFQNKSRMLLKKEWVLPIVVLVVFLMPWFQVSVCTQWGLILLNDLL